MGVAHSYWFGEVIGAIGVTGDVNEVDDICAIAGIRAAGLKSDEDFSEAEAKRLNIKSGPKQQKKNSTKNDPKSGTLCPSRPTLR